MKEKMFTHSQLRKFRVRAKIYVASHKPNALVVVKLLVLYGLIYF